MSLRFLGFNEIPLGLHLTSGSCDGAACFNALPFRLHGRTPVYFGLPTRGFRRKFSGKLAIPNFEALPTMNFTTTAELRFSVAVVPCFKARCPWDYARNSVFGFSISCFCSLPLGLCSQPLVPVAAAAIFSFDALPLGLHTQSLVLLLVTACFVALPMRMNSRLRFRLSDPLIQRVLPFFGASDPTSGSCGAGFLLRRASPVTEQPEPLSGFLEPCFDALRLGRLYTQPPVRVVAAGYFDALLRDKNTQRLVRSAASASLDVLLLAVHSRTAVPECFDALPLRLQAQTPIHVVRSSQYVYL